jgi:hypothetical protein
MKTLPEVTQAILARPTPEVLVDLQGALLQTTAAEPPPTPERAAAVGRALALAGHFYRYLSELQTKISARAYSEFASWLDIGAVGSVALENVIGSDEEHFWRRLLLGGVGESLMVAASRQYVKAWEAETGTVHRHAAWLLAGELWEASLRMQPAADAGQRWQAIQALLAPADDPGVPSAAKGLLVARVFQILLLTYLSQISED